MYWLNILTGNHAKVAAGQLFKHEKHHDFNGIFDHNQLTGPLKMFYLSISWHARFNNVLVKINMQRKDRINSM